MCDPLAHPVPDALPETLAGARQAALRLERGPADRAALLHARHLMHRVEAACRLLDRAGPGDAAAAGGRALDRVRSGALATAPDLVTGLLRALDHIEAAAAGPGWVGADADADAAGIIEALDTLAGDVAERSSRAVDPPPAPVSTTLPALIVEAGGRRFAVPGASVVDPAVPAAAGRSPPLSGLSELLRVPQAAGTRPGEHIVVAAGAGALGLVVDRALGTRPVATRPPAPILRRNPLLGGSAALDDGEIVVVLNVDGIATVTADCGLVEEMPAAHAAPPLPARPRRGAGSRVLLIEESGFASVPAPGTRRPRLGARWIARVPTSPGSPRP